MKSLLIFTLGAFLAMQAPDPARPFPNHEQPEEGYHCVTARNAKEVETDRYACDCRGMMMDDPAEHCKKEPILDEEGNPTGETYMPENRKCKAWCHKDFCLCSNKCKDS